MDLLNRDMQRELLQFLAGYYPDGSGPKPMESIAPGHALRVNLSYLAEHRLVEVKYGSLSGDIPGEARITAKGMDFLANDGGLGAILGVVTVKLHEETLKQLIAEKIQGSDLPAPDKKRFLDQLRELPGETTKHLVLKLVDAGLQNWPQALQLLQNALPG